jgi:hypothetical protein
MLHRKLAAAMAAIAALTVAGPAEAGAHKRFVTPVHVPPDHVYPVPIRPPLSGVYLVSREPRCPGGSLANGRTRYYFNGRWANRPDSFFAIRD